MSIRTASEQMAGPIGKELAASDDVAQAELLNGFFEMLPTLCGTLTSTQYAYIADKLSPRARKGIEELAGFCRIVGEK